MKTFKGRARGWFYADQLCRAAKKENLDSEGCGDGEGPAGSHSDKSPEAGVQRQQPGTQERDGWGVHGGRRDEAHEERSHHQ